MCSKVAGDDAGGLAVEAVLFVAMLVAAVVVVVVAGEDARVRGRCWGSPVHWMSLRVRRKMSQV